jgi:hypothetical protein
MRRRLRRRRRPVESTRLDSLERQVSNLEGLVEGLQDAVHRDAVRRDQDLAELRHQISPEALARALSDDARKRGLQ